ncbi:MAG: hypothetical protein DMG83_11145 [Acidobacteria bacterium]|nr:MAG: hypothetical protein DMG83_11145 [Acidobacteriota bacterium]
MLRNEKDIGKVYNEGLHIETKAAVTRERLERLRKNWDFDRVLKGRGFSRAVSAAKSVAASAAGENCGCRKDFFRSLWSRDDPRHGDPWWKWLSASQEIETAARSFDSVRLAPHFAQDDRQ